MYLGEHAHPLRGGGFRQVVGPGVVQKHIAAPSEALVLLGKFTEAVVVGGVHGVHTHRMLSSELRSSVGPTITLAPGASFLMLSTTLSAADRLRHANTTLKSPRLASSSAVLLRADV